MTIKKIYKEYEATCLRDNLVDFGELLLKSYEIVRDNAAVKAFFHSRFRSILVDEFQDTNTIQYSWLLEIASAETSITAVGDDELRSLCKRSVW